jgi:hypothetical protein
MRCYTFLDGQLTEGIALIEHEEFGRSIYLGGLGRGNVRTHLSLDKKFPPEVQSYVVYTSGWKAITFMPDERHRQPRRFHVLSTTNQDRPGAILLVRGCARYGVGNWATVLGSGWHRRGHKVYDDVVFAIDDEGDCFAVTHSGTVVSFRCYGDTLVAKEKENERVRRGNAGTSAAAEAEEEGRRTEENEAAYDHDRAGVSRG